MFKKHWPVIILTAIIIVGSAIRIHGIARYSFWNDEFFHVFAGQEVVEHGQPILPSGNTYSRAFLYTWFVSLSFRMFGVSEFSARLPSVIFGIMVIPLAYFFVSRFFNRSAGLISSFLLALAPHGILYAHQCRMYTLFQLLYLCTVFLFWEALHSSGRRQRIVCWGAFVGVFLLAIHIQLFSLLLIPTLIIYGVFLLLSERRSLQHALRFLSSQRLAVITALGLAALLSIMLHDKIWGNIQMIMANLDTTPIWSSSRGIRYYHDFLQDLYPVYYRFYPLIALFLIWKLQRKGAYITFLFLVPFILLTFSVGWKGFRYLYPFLSLFLITAAIGTDNLIRAVVLPVKNRTLKVLMAAAVFYALCMPWIKIDPSKFSDVPLYDFSALSQFIKAIPESEPVLVTEPFHLEYYCGRDPDFFINSFDSPGRPRKQVTDSAGRVFDGIGGIPLIGSPEELTLVLDSNKTVWLATNNYFLRENVIGKEMREVILQHFDEVYRDDQQVFILLVSSQDVDT